LSRGRRSASPVSGGPRLPACAREAPRHLAGGLWKRTTAAGGPIPVHGPKKLIDPEEADALWDATMSPQGAANAAHARAATSPELPPRGVTGSQLAQARAAALVVDVQTKRLVLEQRRGALISRDRALIKAFGFARMLRDRWLAWPAKVGPLLAAQFEVDAGTLTVALEGYVRDQLAELASERCEF
jgi:hypothetical protein